MTDTAAPPQTTATRPSRARPGPPGTVPPRGAPPESRHMIRTVARGLLQGTPGRMRVLGAVSVLACLVFGILGFAGVSARSAALGDARSDAAQLVRIQTIRTNLVSADASLTNAFLVGGLEPAAAREAYGRGIETASKTLAEASGANPDDADALDEVNATLATYTGLVEAARANNRQGFPIGAAYLRQATTLLRNDALPVLEKLVRAEEDRVDDAYATSRKAVNLVTVSFIVALVVLVVTQGWLLLRARRWINVGLGAATVVVVLVGVIALATLASSQRKADQVLAEPYVAAVSLATARTDAFDAKSAESLTLIARGSGQTFDKRFDTLSANVTSVLGDARRFGSSADHTDARSAFADYLDVHKKIRDADEGGDYDQAVTLATGGAVDGSNATFAAFDRASGKALATEAARVDDELKSARQPLGVVAGAVLVAGLVAAIAAALGMSTRLKGYR